MNNKKEKVALVLSGGGSRGAYEAGAWQALTDLGINIDVVTGASVGAINGAMVCQGCLDLTINMWKEIETHMIFDVPEGSNTIDYAKEIVINKGAGSSGLKELLDKYVDEDAIRNSPVDYGLVVVERSNLKPHYFFKEDIPPGKIVDYILASSSVYPAVHAHEIDGVEYIDGGYADVLPIGMALDKGATKTIAVRLNAIGVVRHEPIKVAPGLIVVEPKWNLGNVLVFDVEKARRIMRIGYLDTMKAFEIFDGGYYAFAKGVFSKTDLKMGDACAHVLDMDPTLIYSKDSFLEHIKSIVSSCQQDVEEAQDSFKHFKIKPKHIKETIQDIKSVNNSRTLCLLMAKSLKEKGIESMFISRAAFAVIPEHVLAARFLVKYNIV